MMNSDRFLIDSNVFIEAKYFHYNFNYCRKFWDFILELHKAGLVYSINAVKKELIRKEDELCLWVKNEVPDSFFEDEASSMGNYAKLMVWSQNLNVHDKAKEDFADISKADAFLIAHAMTHKMSLITQEKEQAGAKKRILIPNAAKENGVKTLTIYEFLARYSGQNFSIK
ncbi:MULTISPECIES: DUF4411 family protein [Providencia]|uniref:DUF4411 family protein n=1 Tax=Providencia TaxID=586 RepID=UPI00234BCBA4|nr:MULTISPECIES: DUF4411 family protein [unclassified Providencia]